MKKLSLLFIILLFVSCSEENNPVRDIIDSQITATERIDEVKAEAVSSFASDAKLAGIYGVNVDDNGEIDLSVLSPLNTFVYIFRSELKGEIEFYVPVFGAGPEKFPISLSEMIGLINDSDVKDKVGIILDALSTVSISSSATIYDSDWAMNEIMSDARATTFLGSNSTAKVDMFLVPSKSIEESTFTDGADWIVHLYTSSASKVFWINTGTGIITEF
ncbi:MAG: hypothetical protein K9J16_05990 [Melioribacteraceae bacterium]|nr:hypothetical protein [Melioribacteraceae bacterium]MCF8354630.1 hypothetical protein [Melioribacteraceae bacterium]MCF8395018.1 hypothetical protein [Melioribacteraceae bacterium]MCF8418878.1 hypothetical protein [Melioribacteraceae bacterium]